MSRPALSIFFPCYNDGGTIASMVLMASIVARRLVPSFEVIVVDDGSADYARELLDELARRAPGLRVIGHDTNRGYGGALRTGFAASSGDLVFYTDGDAQYDVRDLEHLFRALTPDVDVVNGWKIARQDPLHRIVIGRIYHWIVKWTFGIRLRDVDCDFRLIRRHVLDRIVLESDSGVICVELMRKIQDSGARVSQVPVRHLQRCYGRSQFFNFRRVFKVGVDLVALWFRLVLGRGARRRGVPPSPSSAGRRDLAG